MIDGYYGKQTHTGPQQWKMEFFHISKDAPLFTCFCDKMKKQDAQKEGLRAFRDFLKNERGEK